MKILLHFLVITALTVAPAFADKSVKAGPRHGRVLELSGQNAEFFVEPDRAISIAFYDAAMKEHLIASQIVTAIAESPAGKTKIDFVKKGNLLKSTTPLPPGSGYTVVIQVKSDPAAKTKNFRIPLILETCKVCGNAEYACTCDE